MIVEIVDNLGQGSSLRLTASQVVVRNDSGTPIMIAGEFGDRGIKVAHAADRDFQQVLQAFGVGQHVVVDVLQLSKPVPGAKKLFGPTQGV